MLRRGVALVIDTLIVAIVVVPLGYGIQQVVSDAIHDGAAWLSASSVALLLYLGYFTLFESRGGKTVGKKLLGMHVRKRVGGSITMRESVTRNVLRVIDGFPFVFVPGVPPFYFAGATFMLITEHGQRLGDWAADTVVVMTAHDLEKEPARPRTGAHPRPPTPTPARRRRK